MDEPWTPTMELRWTASGLQQRWGRKVIEYRTYGGNERRCESWEHEWRAVPTVTVTLAQGE